MKKTSLFTLLISGMMVLSSCMFINRGNSESSSSSQTSSEQQSSEESSSSSSSENRYINRIYLEDDTIYPFGTVYQDSHKIDVKVQYSDGEVVEIGKDEVEYVKVKSIKHSSNVAFAGDEYLNLSGKYTATVEVKVGTKISTSSVKFEVLTGLESNIPVTDVSIISNHEYSEGELILENLDVDVEIFYSDFSEVINITNETYTSFDKLSFNLYDVTDTSLNIIDQPLKRNVTYVLKAEVNNVEYGGCYIELSNGVIRLTTDEITIRNSDIKSSYAPSTGAMKVLIIPYTLVDDVHDGKVGEFTDKVISNFENIFFSDNKNSFKYYYETASFGKLHVEGFIADVVELDATVSSVNGSSINALINLYPTIVDKLFELHPDVDFSEYDINDDGCFDNVHLIHNYTSDVWSSPLWPHMAGTGFVGTLEKPSINVYSSSSIGATTDAITAIHEQGHIFGLEDYYDYTDGSVIDYVGYADMQSLNMFDWNSYSKFSVGWVEPLIVTGEDDDIEITMSAASLNGDCLVIPADFNTYNKSAFDEYILIELFSPYGLNEQFWQPWNNYRSNIINGVREDINLGGFGVRLYHVDSRLVGMKNGYYYEVDSNLDEYTRLDVGTNNSSNYAAYPTGYRGWADFKLLNLIQEHGIDTFGTNVSGDYILLNGTDLFHEGDVFTFDKYKHFFSKSGKEVTTMNNGEDFPWTIEFTAMSKDSVTIRVHK